MIITISLLFVILIFSFIFGIFLLNNKEMSNFSRIFWTFFTPLLLYFSLFLIFERFNLPKKVGIISEFPGLVFLIAVIGFFAVNYLMLTFYIIYKKIKKF